MTTKLYDSKCFDLAEAFLSDEEGLTDDQRKRYAAELAAHIQEAIESWLQYELGVLKEGDTT